MTRRTRGGRRRRHGAIATGQRQNRTGWQLLGRSASARGRVPNELGKVGAGKRTLLAADLDQRLAVDDPDAGRQPVFPPSIAEVTVSALGLSMLAPALSLGRAPGGL